jgi:hypothetical protein
MVSAVLQNHNIILTHGDFAGWKVLVRGSKVVAILGWEFASKNPEYWEYLKALLTAALGKLVG